MTSLAELPKDLPVPVDDGACNHLLNRALPSMALSSTQGRTVDLSAISGWIVIYCYPMTGKPGVSLPQGWDQIPGARGCTPQSCAFRDRYRELEHLNTQVYGISTQSTEYQQEAVERLHLPYELLSDAELHFATLLKLPRFEVEGRQLIKRLTLIAQDGNIIKVFYPVFPPDRNVDEVVEWLQNSSATQGHLR
jgi:peroxiredoxin